MSQDRRSARVGSSAVSAGRGGAGWLAVVALVVALVASAAVARADAFAELRQPERAWTFEIVEGTSIGALKKVKGTPLVKGWVLEVKAIGQVTRVLLKLKGVESLKGKGLGDNMLLWLALDGTELRQSHAPAEERINDLGNARGFTFPLALAKPWKVVRTTDYGTVTIEVRAEKMKLGGTSTPVWVARSVGDDGEAKMYELAAYAPGLGPALICARAFAAKPTWRCARLVAAGAPATP